MDNNWSLEKQMAWDSYKDAVWRYNSWAQARWQAIYEGNSEEISRIDARVKEWDEEKDRRLAAFNSIPE